MDAYTRQLKKKIIRVRFTALAASILGIFFILAYFFNLLNKWICIIGLSYTIALTFTLNSTYQDVGGSKAWKGINTAMAVLGYVATLGIIVYAFVAGVFRF